MRKMFLSLAFLAWSLVTIGVNWIDINSQNQGPVKIKMISSTIDRSLVHFALDGFNLHEVQTTRGVAYRVTVGKSTPILEAGAPDLPKITTSLVIPDQAGMSVRVVSSKFRDYPLHLILAVLYTFLLDFSLIYTTLNLALSLKNINR